MSLYVVIGAGPVGSATAELLAARGAQVRVITRRGLGPDHPSVERVAADATDAAALTRQCTGADVVFQCAQPPYHRWATDFPPLAAATLQAAEATGAALLSVGNLYGYGQVDGPISERHPLRPNSVKGRVRAELWAEALAAHQAGRVRVAEVRGSDYLGAGAKSAFTMVALPAVLSGRRALLPADPDAAHSWTDVTDTARTLVAVADDEDAWGRAWHTPTAPPVSVRELAGLAATVADAPPARVSRMPAAMLWAAGIFDPNAREMREMRYQFDRPFVLDSSAATAAFGIEPTPTVESLRATITALRAEEATSVG
ncbi:NAD-dependent epimerase/dehydratase family protein [Nocardia gipuzkoensis]|uniref:NAD-dependent epimerase/dehydratase family protein n=1 Tax=Nocardia gipuzkoensis TaxID=2749991 RepID=UPI00237D890C|nr:NAD-dependent epimerase/dehydratase family protein [Nocardia gipuzkoensis]MDE1673657.1 NAD-dependent epimerase/dehydratase family protein [Nocardia gipuzkoensis]